MTDLNYQSPVCCKIIILATCLLNELKELQNSVVREL